MLKTPAATVARSLSASAVRTTQALTSTSAKPCSTRTTSLGSIDQSGSKDVVSLVSTTPCAIGYSGMGYATDDVKMGAGLESQRRARHLPTVENAASGAYPIARPLHIYTAGEPTGAVKDYLGLDHVSGRPVIVLSKWAMCRLVTQAAADEAAPAGDDAGAEEQPAQKRPPTAESSKLASV